MRRLHLVTLLISLMEGVVPVASQAQTPLIMEGKSTLYQRVLVREGSPRYAAPGTSGGGSVLSLQALWVYGRQEGWVQVGPDDGGAGLFWLPETAVIDWKQNIVATFEGSENVGRVLFFKDFDSAYDVVESEEPGYDAGQLRQEAQIAERGGAPSETLVALGPRELVDLRKNLYVMPILESEEAVFENGAFVNLLKVAVARAAPADRALIAPAPQGEGAIRENYRAAVVFVVDTTVSMQPYINATRDALEDIFDQVSRSNAGDVISFGLIGYRDNLKAAPGLEYDAKTFVNLQDGQSPQKFREGISRMAEARESSVNFREDAYAGVDYALSAMNWEGFGARFIVLVTDAGPREANDKLSTTGLSAAGLNSIVRERLGAAIAVMHLRTPRGKNDHASAEAAYRELTSLPNLPPLYFPIEKGDPDKYRDSARGVAQLIVDQVVGFRGPPGDAPEPRGADDSPLASVGRSMQLAYLGTQTRVRAPDVFEAVVADRDFERTGLKPLSIRLLISKLELSDLEQALRLIIEKAEENVIDPDKFFAQVLGAAADMSRRPEQIAGRATGSLAQAVAIDEYLDGLPYKSRIMAITEDDWVRMSISEQQTVVNELYEKIERYRRYNEATDAWVDYMGAGSDAATLVYPMPLDDLP
ncbi:vWA domain-containing protein [Pseudodonghicola xiamenensis]|uniref:VWFA domain-containing protein n=1 Tax=Pseudodonghicola xiamenensis TaxID=337702 RepID=A0A8J3H7Z3_9RHOB|nr:vWA domain-containing protein [Pseudodonghicola xiamenensis]GHG98425.1 hypothetical protein GCM10010961_33730 [Pseudodonghicola xiamenensis]